MFLFDWRMGLLCLGTVLLAIIVMVTLMTGPTLKRKLGEYNKALDSMSNEAVEYVRGIPVVKTFGPSVFSFKRFKASIDQYQKWVIAYTIDLRRPMTLSTFAYADVRDGGLFNRLCADWAATDQIHAILGYDYFHADKGMFARYAHNSEVWVKLKYCF